MKYIASGEDFFVNDEPHCIIIDADDFGEALSIYKRCFTDDCCINIDKVSVARGYPAPTHNHVIHGAHHHAVPIQPEEISVADKDLDIEPSDLNGFNVMFSVAINRQVNGCPMGRGRTVNAAKADLKRRTEIESAVIITFTE